MIHINITEAKWTELEKYHKEHIYKTVPKNWRVFRVNTKIQDFDKWKVYQIFQCQKIDFPRPDDSDDAEKKLTEKQLQSLIDLCVSENIDEWADKTSKDKLFQNLSDDKKKLYIGYINSILGYEKFSEGAQVKMSNGKMWCRHSFMDEIGIKVCPYCNRQYITSYYWENKVRTTTDTDHYYPKSNFPLLSMNIHNMVPSCQICNSRMKLNKVNNTKERHLNPYVDGSDSLRFEIPFTKLSDLYNFKKEDIHILLNENVPGEVSKRAKHSKEIFKLEQVYEAHKDIVFDLKNSIKEYSNEKYNQIFCKNYTDIYGGYEKFMEVLYPFLTDNDTMVPLTKMKKDIYFYIKERIEGENKNR